MKRILYIILVIAPFMFSCDKTYDINEPFHWNPSDNCLELGLRREGAKWDEIEYKSNNPSQFRIYHYEVRDSDFIYCDSLKIGKFIYNTNEEKLYIQKVNSNNSVLLYDFKAIRENKVGEYDISNNHLNSDFFLPPTFITYGTTQEKRSKIYKEYMRYGYEWRWLWDYDEYGGKTITGIGSTGGILNAILEEPAVGFTREVLQAYWVFKNPKMTFEQLEYKMNSNGGGREYLLLNDFYYYGYVYYYAPDSPVAPYLPEDFWVQPWVIEKYKEYKESQK